jgi:iron complex outermembrane recepter protein
VSTRGFTEQYANKLLVLVDGRSVYSPMFAGVYWNTQDMLLEDLDRIEVIRGPGATLWGANAVNGVINITSKSAKETQGGLITTSFGSEERPTIGARYGGQLAHDVYYRTYVKTFQRRGFMPAEDGETPDSWDTTRFGGRLDWEPATANKLTLQTDYYRGSVSEHFDTRSLTPPFTTHATIHHHNFGGHLLGRWTRVFSPASQLAVQAYFDRFHHGDGDITETRTTFDLDVQHRFPVGERHDVVWGFGSRTTEDRLAPTFYLSFDPERARERFHSAFLQDEITLVPQRLKFTLGSKFEYTKHAGLQAQPSGRLLWTPVAGQTIWTSVSRAIRIPSRYDRDARLNSGVFQPPSSPPILVALISEKDAKPETLNAFEFGYRIEPHRRLSVDVAAFYNRYAGIFTYVPGAIQMEATPEPAHLLFPLYFKNAVSGETYGSEVSMQWRATDRLKFVASQSWLRMRLQPDETPEAQNPRRQFGLRSYLDLTHTVQLTMAAYYSAGITAPVADDKAQIDSMLRLDVGISWRPRSGLELGVWGQNLLDPQHAEFGSFKTHALTEVPRSILGRVTWTY